MKELVIKIAPFVFKQTVFIKEDGEWRTVEVPHKELTSFISLEPDVKTVHLFGNEKMVKKVQEECVTKYSLADIEFKIN